MKNGKNENEGKEERREIWRKRKISKMKKMKGYRESKRKKNRI